MIQAARNKRRALIVRRQVAYRTEQAKRERREAQADDDEVVGEDDLLAELPEVLIG